MAKYQFELGINGTGKTGLPTSGSSTGKIQVGFANTTNGNNNGIAAYPANIQPGDQINFVIFDLSTSNGNTSTLPSDSGATEQPSLTVSILMPDGNTSTTLFTSPPDTWSLGTWAPGTSFSFGGDVTAYKYCATGYLTVAPFSQPGPPPVNNPKGMYNLTFTITINVPATESMPAYTAKWYRDPEMIVGGWG